MVASFALFTLGVAVVEVVLRLGVVLYDFRTEAREETELAAERLATDVRSIMLNRGGPVASRTVYPILQRSFRRSGLEIAIEPTDVTTTSIESLFGFTPRGLPAEWPSGRHAESRVELRAGELCLQCHSQARVGDVLGTVTVRNYLDTRLSDLWAEARITGGINVVKVLLHSVILFFLLRALMEPLLSLRSAVARLAKGEAGMSLRAQVRSTDEFGDLAHDLNVFLDRVDHILADLERTIARMVDVGTRLENVTATAKEHMGRLEREALDAGRPGLVHEMHGVRHVLTEIAHLEDQLAEVAADGRRLLERLVRSGALDEEGGQTVRT
jgi:methyl-accepting chemotaxis protein